MPKAVTRHGQTIYQLKTVVIYFVYDPATTMKYAKLCSSGYDVVPVWHVKPLAESITSPLVDIINKSID